MRRRGTKLISVVLSPLPFQLTTHIVQRSLCSSFPPSLPPPPTLLLSLFFPPPPFIFLFLSLLLPPPLPLPPPSSIPPPLPSSSSPLLFPSSHILLNLESISPGHLFTGSGQLWCHKPWHPSQHPPPTFHSLRTGHMTLQSEGRTIKTSNVHQMYIKCTSHVHHITSHNIT